MTEQNQTTIDINEILELIPHRYPFLLIDRVLSYESYKSIRAVKNVSMNEPFFQGHFPGKPVMPGVLILEAMAQATAVLAFKTMKEKEHEQVNKGLFLFAGADKVKFKKMVLPGHQLILDINITKNKGKIWKASAKATVDNTIACVADLTAAYSQRD